MVTVRFKTVQQQNFQVDLEPSTLIADVKKKIEESQGFPAANQKLIYSGKILEDSKDVASYNIGEKDFVVVMVTKPKAAPKPAPEATASAPAEKPKPAEAKPTVPVPAPATGSVSAFSSLATGPEYENAVNNLVEMGFDKEQVKSAMRAAFNNPDRAAEYLMTGNIPQVAEQPPAAAASPQQPAAPGTPDANLFQAAAQASQPEQPAGSDDNALAFLRDSPQFQQLRQLVQSQPEMLQPLLQQIGQSNPQLLQLINQNQDAFMRVLFEGAVDQIGDDEEGAEGAEGGAQYIQITAEENEAINRLAALGFDRTLAAEAYFACDKNEELAANYLFDQAQNDFQ